MRLPDPLKTHGAIMFQHNENEINWKTGEHDTDIEVMNSGSYSFNLQTHNTMLENGNKCLGTQFGG